MFKISHSPNLNGEINISGSKNAALPIVAANFIANNKIKLNNKPDIKDLVALENIANYSLKTSKDYFDLTGDDVTKIRASILLIPLGLIKYGKVKFFGSGGCNIGKRPLDTFDDALIQAGIQIKEEDFKTFEVINKPNKNIILSKFSVTATESLITYLAFLENIDYEIKVSQIAIEPHVINLIEYLRLIGAEIKLNYNHSITIRPKKLNIQEAEFDIISDYIQAGTYFGIGAVAENSEIIINNCNYEDLIAMLDIASKIGINYKILNNKKIKVNSHNKSNYKAVKLETRIFPGFPTDLQSIFGALLTQANGISKIFETLFEGRFSYLLELENLGAHIEVLNPHQVIIIGPKQLQGAYVSTTDLRGGGAMVLAGIIAKGTTYITNEDIILRGYDSIITNLKSIGVDIEKTE